MLCRDGLYSLGGDLNIAEDAMPPRPLAGEVIFLIGPSVLRDRTQRVGFTATDVHTSLSFPAMEGGVAASNRCLAGEVRGSKSQAEGTRPSFPRSGKDEAK